MTTKPKSPISHIEAEHFADGDREIIQVRIERVAKPTKRYIVSQASESRISAAQHGKAICRWPLGGGRSGWFANMYISDERWAEYTRQCCGCAS